ncbi:kinase-like domain-containing protein, partial [Mycena leptocephala]
SLAAPASPVTEVSPWVTSSSSDLHRAIVKRLRVDSLEVEGKVLTNSFDVGTSFARELRFFRTVSPHPNLVEFYGHIDGVGLVIEAIDGVTIHDKIEKAPFPSDTVKLRWANQLIQAILHIHSFGLSHGDISPGNVLIDSEVTLN